MKPEFNHCYTPDPGHRFHSSLGRRGFSLHPNTVEHPGQSRCRFIMFMAADGRTRVYLEFISKPGRKHEPPGLSFAVRGSLKGYYLGLGKTSFLRPRFKHRNYAWKERGTKERLPGWNFLTFGRKCPGIFIWFTESEPSPEMTKMLRKTRHLVRHANGVGPLVGIDFSVNAAGRRYFEGLLGRRLDKPIVLPCGTEVSFTPARRTAFRAVVLRARGFPRFLKEARPDRVEVRDGLRTAVLTNPAGSWDMVVQGT
ncbi:MAG: hypothetical protein HYV15_07330 [Elusimicrobia bacterium]|nr:hypothetical protein [Elusimicrobiota bacterium]